MGPSQPFEQKLSSLALATNRMNIKSKGKAIPQSFMKPSWKPIPRRHSNRLECKIHRWPLLPCRKIRYSDHPGPSTIVDLPRTFFFTVQSSYDSNGGSKADPFKDSWGNHSLPRWSHPKCFLQRLLDYWFYSELSSVWSIVDHNTLGTRSGVFSPWRMLSFLYWIGCMSFFTSGKLVSCQLIKRFIS